MSGVVDVITGKGGERAADASLEAAQIQGASTDRAADITAQSTRDVIASNEAAAATARSDLQPFRDAGAQALPGLSSDLEGIRNLVTDPNAQADFVQNNPFFDALADDAQRRLFNNQSARGKVGSGGTAEALQNSILLLGNGVVNQNVNQRQGVFNSGLNIANLGGNAAAGQANVSTGTAASNAGVSSAGASNISNLITGGANAQASGIVGAANAQNAAAQGQTNAALGIASLGVALSDENEKENITFVGMVKSIPYYFFNYIGESKTMFGTMAQRVEHIPDAVMDMGGKKYVNYGVINAC